MSDIRNGIGNSIYIGTILLELNRWGSSKTPTYLVSEWLDRFQEAGFDGMELWEYHATLCPPEELAKLEASDFPVAVYNTYCDFSDESKSDQHAAADMIRRFGAKGVKFNVGKDPALKDMYLQNLRAWGESLPEDCRLLCECHGGTIVEEPAEASKFFGELEGDRWQFIVHCLMSDVDRLKEWFGAFGQSITHAHIQITDENGKRIRMESDTEHVKNALNIMRGEGYQGSFTLEFTEGTSAPDENMGDLWKAALDDLDFLRSLL
ncbi:sugar phosphate isomerase/epimerase family protein [Candidatus Poribacteria bacterium]